MEFLFKSALIIATLVLFYRLFLQRETFFQSIRGYFIVGAIASLLLPLLIITTYIEIEAPSVHELQDTVQRIPSSTETATTTVSATVADTVIDWDAIIHYTYWIGLLILGSKLFIELLSLIYLLYKSKRKKEGNYILTETEKEISPFSFFNWIVYNKNLFTAEELNDIIAHEKVHVDQKHSIDILFMQLITLFQWFNPFVWLLKKDAQQNLEYIADKGAQQNAKTKKKYQYLLLKASTSRNPFALSTNFYNSHLKKRIIMLQKSQTKRFHQLKYFLLVPLIALFLYSFTIKEVRVLKNAQTTSESIAAVANQIIINSKTSYKEFEDYKTAFRKKYNVDLKFYGIKRNSNGEITSIKIKGKSKNSSASFSISSDGPIDNIRIGYEKESDEISIETMGAYSHSSSSGHSNYSTHVNTDTQKRNTTHIVKKGESFYSIAKKYGISSEDLHALNPTIDKLTVGTNLTIGTPGHSSISNRFIYVNENEDDNGNGVQKRSEVQIINNGNSDSFSFSFVDDNVDDDENTITTYIINGKKMSKEAFKKFDKSKIRSMEIKKEAKKDN